MVEYNHPDHGEMEEHRVNKARVQIDGYRCSVCHVVADKENPDEVFDQYDCEQYENVQKEIIGNL